MAYFPSYEIITGPHIRGRYFDADLRSVREQGGRHVMRLFFQHATTMEAATPAPREATPDAADAFLAKMEKVVEVICDEAALQD